MSSIPLSSFILAVVAAAIGFTGWAYSYRLHRRRRLAAASVTSETSVTAVQTPELLGELDGRARIPNELTRVPFPTPAMDGYYEAGEKRRAEAESRYVERIKHLQIRERVLSERAELLKNRMAHANGHAAAVIAREAELVDESLAARRAAIDATEKDRLACLEALDAETQMLLNQYWGANLRVRERSPEGTDLDSLIVPDPSQWRDARPEGAPDPRGNR